VTTYTVTWTVTNPLNNLTGATVVATLPPYMKWLNNVSPDSEKVSYDSNTNQITWNVGNVSSGAGSISPAREVSFQVSILPSVSQIGSTPDLIEQATVSSIFQAVTTELSNDPYFKADTSKVVK
jgi:hypothetical protein